MANHASSAVPERRAPCADDPLHVAGGTALVLRTHACGDLEPPLAPRVYSEGRAGIKVNN